jgi:hypothetical protein
MDELQAGNPKIEQVENFAKKKKILIIIKVEARSEVQPCVFG